MTLSWIYWGLCIALGLWILIDAIVHRRKIDTYLKYGALFCLVLAVIQVSALYVAGLPKESRRCLGALLMAVLPLLDILILTCIGMDSCAATGGTDVPLLKRLFGAGAGTDRVSLVRCSIWTANTAIAATAFSLALFWLTSPRMAPTLRALVGPPSGPSLIAGLVFVRFAVVEEITYRLAVQSFLARKLRLQGRRYVVAIVLASALWTLGHAGTLEPEWIKFAQIFPIGIALGFLFRKYGVESCIFAHAIFNVVMMFCEPCVVM